MSDEHGLSVARNDKISYQEFWEVKICSAVIDEFHSAMSKYSPFSSAHEGYATILEELDELWDEIKKKPQSRSKIRMKQEAIQIAAMAIRFIYDLCEKY